MNFVQPIKEKETIKAILKHLKTEDERNYIMFLIGIHSSLMITDLLRIRVQDVQGEEIRLVDRQTGDLIRVPLDDGLSHILQEYIQDKEPWEYLIKSRKGFNAPISRVTAYRIIKDIEREFKLHSMGTHSLRKTFGYHYYLATEDVDALQKTFKHTSPGATLRYIGVLDHDVAKTYKNVKLY